MFSYILVVSTGYILLISLSMLKTGKMKSIAGSAVLTNLFKNYFKGAKNLVAFCSTTKISLTVYFVLELSKVDTVSRS